MKNQSAASSLLFSLPLIFHFRLPYLTRQDYVKNRYNGLVKYAYGEHGDLPVSLIDQDSYAVLNSPTGVKPVPMAAMSGSPLQIKVRVITVSSLPKALRLSHGWKHKTAAI
jgi:hypothetical protein